MTGRPTLGSRRPGPLRVTAAVLIGTGLLLLAAAGPLAHPLGRFVHSAPRVEYAHARSVGPGPSVNFTHVNLTINATDYPSFDPNLLTVDPNTNITFIVHNVGPYYNHTFTLARQPSLPGAPVPDPRESPTQIYQYFNRYGSYVNLSVAPNATAEANFTVTAALAGASFEFLSLVPYQFQAGMFGFLNVTQPLGPGVNLTINATQSLNFVPNLLGVSTPAYPVTVDVAVYDIGVLPHTWTLAPQSNVTLLPSNFTSYFQAHPPLADVSVQSAGVAYWGNFSVGAPGIYEFICKIPGHFNPPSGNMYGFLYVGIPVPENVTPPPPSTAIVQGGVLVGGGALLGFGILLAVIASFGGRFPKTAGAKPGH